MPSATLDPVTPFTTEKPGPEGSRLSVHFSLDLHIHSGRKGVSSAFTNMRKPSFHSGELGQASGSLLHSVNMRGLGTGSRLAPAGPGSMDADVLWSLTSMAHDGDAGTAGRGQGGEGSPRPHRSCCLQATCRTHWEFPGDPQGSTFSHTPTSLHGPARSLTGRGLTLPSGPAQLPMPPTPLVPLHSPSVMLTGVAPPPPAQHRCRSCLSPWTTAFTWMPPGMVR